MQKFSSRKFLAMLAAVLTVLAAVLTGNHDPQTVGQLALGVAAVIAYILGESHVDATAAKATGDAAAAAAAATAPATAIQASTAATEAARGVSSSAGASGQ